jgi:serine/threonine-protein kinase
MSDISLSALERINRICDRFNEAWPARPRPRITEFLRDAPEEDRPELRRALLGEAVFRIKADQRRRWGLGERVSVEEYLREEPALGEEPECILELVDNELALRRERGEVPSAEEYLALLPGHETELRRRFAGGQDVIPPTVDEPRAPDTLRPGTVAETLPAAAQPGEPVPPELGHYRPVGFIGRGGVGDVFLYYDPQMDRELAVKVLREDHRGNPSLVRRFQKEARLNSRLQHPGVVSVHAMERTADGRPYFTMKLVRGRTLADLLAERASPAQDLPRFLAIFEQVCQAVAYAHSQGVIHRDLKPHNVMVGAFAEVQVMDWGLAKVVGPGEDGEAAPAGPETWAAAGPPAGVEGETQPTRAGQVMGTLAYMPPEQARGEVEQVDRHSDVFGLGAILCEVLTGRPPFAGNDESERWARARACDHAGALVRLGGCGADAELVGLCKACLAAEPSDRPRDAGEVARAVAAYQAEVQERLRAAELGRAAAQARAEEAKATAAAERRAAESEKAAAEEARAAAAAERRARRRTLALAAAVLLLVVAGGSAGWWYQQRQQAVDTRVDSRGGEARSLLDQAKRALVTDGGKYREAVQAAENAVELARTGGASAKMQKQAADLVAELKTEAEAADRDLRLLARLPEVRGPRGALNYSLDVRVAELAEPSADEQFAGAFREWGLDVDVTPTAEAAARLRQRPAAVVVEVVAALDEWTSERRTQLKPRAGWQRLADLAAALDDDPGSKRRELRAILDRDNSVMEKRLGELSRALLPFSALADIVPGEDRNRLRRMAEASDAATEPILNLQLLARALKDFGDSARAERLLRAAVRARPQEVVLRYTLGGLLERQQPPKWREALECYEVVRALRPQFGPHLASVLVESGQAEEGIALAKRLVAERPDDPWLHATLGGVLNRQARYGEAAAAYREVVRLRPDFEQARYRLTIALSNQRRLKEAEAELREWMRIKRNSPEAHCALARVRAAQRREGEAVAALREAIRLKPDLAEAHLSLGILLVQHPFGREAEQKEAEAAYRAVIRLKPDHTGAYHMLGVLLQIQGRYREAEAAFREVVRLKPDSPEAHQMLGLCLGLQRRYREEEAAYREVIRLKPDYYLVHEYLGNALMKQGRLKEAEAAFREAIRLAPDFYLAHDRLGDALQAQGLFREAEEAFREAMRCLSFRPRRFKEQFETKIQECRRLLEVDRKLTAILQGEAEPTSATECLELADLCRPPYKRLHKTAVRFYTAAFAVDPSENNAAFLRGRFGRNRYNAACSAVLAAAGQADDARQLPDKVAFRLRQQAFDWLKAELASSAKQVERSRIDAFRSSDGGRSLRLLTARYLTWWKENPDLTSVRDREPLNSLPEAERILWQQLWADVDALLKAIRE